LRLLIITPSFYPATYYGGPIYSTYELAKALGKNDINVYVVTTNANGDKRLKIKTNTFLEVEKNLFIKYYGLASNKGFSPFMFLLLWNDFLNADLIYLVSIFSPPTLLALLLNIFFKKKIIISPRGQLGEWCLAQGNALKKLWLKIIITPFAKNLTWHATSSQEEEMIKKVYAEANIWVLPNGIDIDKFKDIKHKKDKLFYKKYSDKVNQNSKVIISMGRLQKVKGFDILIEAYKKVQAQVKDAILLIAGEDFGEKSNLLRLISSNNLSDKVFLVGHIEGEEKINFLKNADVFALPSHHENFGMVYAEALAAGTPVVASTNTPWQDVEKFNCGKWVENTSDKFAEATIEILRSDPIQMGNNGREYVEDYFSWDKIAKSFIHQINMILN